MKDIFWPSVIMTFFAGFLVGVVVSGIVENFKSNDPIREYETYLFNELEELKPNTWGITVYNFHNVERYRLRVSFDDVSFYSEKDLLEDFNLFVDRIKFYRN